MKSVADTLLPKDQHLPNRYTIFRIARLAKVDCSIMVMRLVIISTALYWLMSGQHLWFFVGATCVALTFLPRALVQNLALRQATDLCVTTLLMAHMIFGMQIGLYEMSSIYDKIMHMLGCSAITALTIFAVLQHLENWRSEMPSPFLFLSILGFVIGLGTLWEIFEFAIDSTGLFRSQRGLDDTMFDLIANTIGALTALGVFAGLVRS